MKNINEMILKFIAKNDLSVEQCASRLGVSKEKLEKLVNRENVKFTEKETEKILSVLDNKREKGKKLVKMLDLIFRFVAMVMALVTLLLCINENIDAKVLIVLLSIGLVCSSMTILPKIEK